MHSVTCRKTQTRAQGNLKTLPLPPSRHGIQVPACSGSHQAHIMHHNCHCNTNQHVHAHLEPLPQQQARLRPQPAVAQAHVT
jgi:hypothetical protein